MTRIENQGRHRTADARVLVLVIGVLAGCGGPRAGDAPVQVVRERPEPMTVEQRRATFAEAYGRGLGFVDAGDYALALSAFEVALQADPQSTAALIAVGACYENLYDPVEAIRYYRHALAIDPAEAEAHTNLGTAYIKLYHRERNPNWRDMALASWRQSLALKPDQDDVRGYLSRASAELAADSRSGQEPE